MAATSSEYAPPCWRLILGAGGSLEPARGARNMAIDHALLEAVQAGAPPALRLYRWQPACLSFGRNQQTLGIYDPERARDAGIDVARRPTGGLAVLHDQELTYSVVAPVQRLGGPRAAYTLINRALVEGLRQLGVPATLAAGGPRRGPISAAAEPCFQAPAAGEVVARGRKLIGSAQRAERHALLQHGSILLSGTQADVLRLLVAREPGAPATAAGSITLRELLGHVPAEADLVTSIASGFEQVCGIRLAPRGLSRDEAARAAVLEDRYTATSWTWRR